ncbi:MAG: hypothetical protein Kow00133_15350 [Amphiplicatus sp.]
MGDGPLRDIANVRKIEQAIARGRLIGRDGLPKKPIFHTPAAEEGFQNAVAGHAESRTPATRQPSTKTQTPAARRLRWARRNG